MVSEVQELFSRVPSAGLGSLMVFSRVEEVGGNSWSGDSQGLSWGHPELIF